MGGEGVPVKWERLGETIWYKVETSTKRVYYYNCASQESQWERPEVAIPEPTTEEPHTLESAESSANDIAAYKALIKELKLPPSVTFNSALPRLVFDDRFRRIPQSQRRQLFDKIRRELVKESSRTLREISKDYMNREFTPESTKVVGQNTSRLNGEKTSKYSNSSNQTDATRRKRYAPASEGRGRARRRPKSTHRERARQDMATEMARTAFLSLLHEKVKMPFTEGDIEPIDESLILGDPRSQSQFLRDRERTYLEFVSDFLVSRIALFEERLSSLSNDHLNTPIEKVIQILDTRLFEHLPRSQLSQSLHWWRMSEKSELVDSFKILLRQTLCYAEGTPEDNLARAAQQLSHDKRYQRMECIPDERDRLILDRLRELKENHRN